MVCLFLTLFSVLASADGPERSAAIDSLATSGDVAWISQAIHEVGWRERDGLIEALEKIGSDAVPALMRIARTHPKTDAQRLAIRSMGYVGASARDSLREIVTSPHRDLVAEALGCVGDAGDATLLRPLLSDTHYDVRRRAALALAKLVADEAAEDLAVLLGDSHHGVRFAAAGALVAMAEKGGEAVLSQYAVLPITGKYLALGIFGQLKLASARGVLLKALHHKDWSLRSAAAGFYNFDDVVDALASRLAVESHPLVCTQLQNILSD